jgi:hypothetical protein
MEQHITAAFKKALALNGLNALARYFTTNK